MQVFLTANAFECFITAYSVKSKQFMIIQQRASFVKGKRKLFRKKLLEWIKNQQFKVVYLIGSMYAHMRTDQQLTG